MDYVFSIINKFVFFIVLIIALMQWNKTIKSAGKQFIPVLRWTMITCAAIQLLVLLYSVSKLSGPQRINGPYAWAYILMLAGNTILPFILLLKKPGHNPYVLLLITILMNIGWILELFIIITIYYAH